MTARKESRRESERRLEDQRDMAALDIPELRAIQRRWAMAIEAIVPGLDPADAYARMDLIGLRSSIEGFESVARTQALIIERRIAELRAKMVVGGVGVEPTTSTV